MLQTFRVFRSAKPVMVNGTWQKPAVTGKKLAVIRKIEFDNPPRPVSVQKERIQSRIIKAKKRYRHFF